MFVTNFLFSQNQWFFQLIKVFFAKKRKKEGLVAFQNLHASVFFHRSYPVKTFGFTENGIKELSFPLRSVRAHSDHVRPFP